MQRDAQRGFSLLEMMLTMVIFMIVSGAVFMLLNSVQARHRAEQEFLDSFAGARLGVDLIVRDVHNAGYPPPYMFAGSLPTQLAGGPTPISYPAAVCPPYPPGVPFPNPLPAAGTWTEPICAPPDLQRRFAVGIVGIGPFGIDPSCTVNGGANPCTIPGPWDFLLEVDLDPENPNPDPVTGLTPQVEWVRYSLHPPGSVIGGRLTSTLVRAVGPKIAGTNPAMTVTSNIPFVEDVVQDSSLPPNELTNPPVFRYECDPDYVIAVLLGPPLVTVCQAEYVKNVYISLQVQSTRHDPQTRQFRRITVQGAATRLNPSR